MSPNDEADLKERFTALRDADATDTPSLERVLRGRTGPPSARRAPWIPVAVLATTAVVTAFLFVETPRRAEPSIAEAIAQAQSISSWNAPTDAWLTLPGLEIPDSVPSLSPSSVTLPESSTATKATGELR
jgi:hypothetical protein